MPGIFLMMMFGKLQDHVGGNLRPWHWALLYTVLSGLLALLLGGQVSVFGLVLAGVYAWGYFSLLQRTADTLMLWLAVYMLMPLLLLPLLA